MRIKDLKLAEYNPRTITDKKLAMMKKSMIGYFWLGRPSFTIWFEDLPNGRPERFPEFDLSPQPFQIWPGYLVKLFTFEFAERH